MTYCSDTAMPYITKIQLTVGQWNAFSLSLRSQELPRYNTYIHNGHDIQCSTTQPHRTQNWEDTEEEPEWLSKISIQDIKNFEYLSNAWRCTCKKPWGNNIIYRLHQRLWLRTQREDGANTTRLETTQRNRGGYYNAKNTKVKVHSLDGDTDYFDIVVGVLLGDTLAPYLFITSRDYVLRASIDIMKDNGFKLAKKKAEDTPHIQFRTRTTPMT